MLNLPWRCSASAMYVNYNLPNLDTVIRRNFVGFIQRLSISQNSIIRALSRVRLWSSRVESRTVLPIVINKFKPKYAEQKLLGLH